jgi:hypothetical protein
MAQPKEILAPLSSWEELEEEDEEEAESVLVFPVQEKAKAAIPLYIRASERVEFGEGLQEAAKYVGGKEEKIYMEAPRGESMIPQKLHHIPALHSTKIGFWNQTQQEVWIGIYSNPRDQLRTELEALIAAGTTNVEVAAKIQWALAPRIHTRYASPKRVSVRRARDQSGSF